MGDRVEPDWLSVASRLNRSISKGVNATFALVLCVDRFIIVSQKMRQLRMQKVASKLTSRSAVRNFDCSAWQPDLRILWKTSILQRSAYHWSFSMACTREVTGRLVIRGVARVESA